MNKYTDFNLLNKKILVKEDFSKCIDSNNPIILTGECYNEGDIKFGKVLHVSEDFPLYHLLNINDIVLYNIRDSKLVKIDSQDHYILNEEDIICIVE